MLIIWSLASGSSRALQGVALHGFPQGLQLARGVGAFY